MPLKGFRLSTSCSTPTTKMFLPSCSTACACHRVVASGSIAATSAALATAPHRRLLRVIAMPNPSWRRTLRSPALIGGGGPSGSRREIFRRGPPHTAQSSGLRAAIDRSQCLLRGANLTAGSRDASSVCDRIVSAGTAPPAVPSGRLDPSAGSRFLATPLYRGGRPTGDPCPIAQRSRPRRPCRGSATSSTLPDVAVGLPRVDAGGRGLDARVRWVHVSELAGHRRAAVRRRDDPDHRNRPSGDRRRPACLRRRARHRRAAWLSSSSSGAALSPSCLAPSSGPANGHRLPPGLAAPRAALRQGHPGRALVDRRGADQRTARLGVGAPRVHPALRRRRVGVVDRPRGEPALRLRRWCSRTSSTRSSPTPPASRTSDDVLRDWSTRSRAAADVGAQ